MMFLIRMTFWLCLLLLFVPVDEEIARSHAADSTVAPFDAVYAAQETLSDVGGFCERSPTACAVGGEFLDMLALKARSGLKMALAFFDDQAAAPAPAPETVGTLRASDLEPGWRGPAQPI